MAIDLESLTITTIKDGLINKKFSVEELTLACLQQFKSLNPRYNAIIIENPDAITDARRIDKKIANGEALGKLAGVPAVVKDPMDMKGIPTTAGWSKLYSKMGGVDLIPERDSPVVDRIRSADAVILGKTNVPILSWTGTHANDSWAGPTINPVVEDRVPGGSSAGTAAAVASHMAVFGLAEETGGSIQNPASAQCLVGIKPTIGLVPNAGVVPLSSNRDVVGPIARNVTDAAIALDTLAGYSIEDPKTLSSVDKIPDGGFSKKLSKDALKNKKIGLYGPGWRSDELSHETEELYERAKSELEHLGAILIVDPFKDTELSKLRCITPGTPFFDGRGLESLPFDMINYLRRLGSEAPVSTWEDFVKITNFDDLTKPGGNLSYLYELPDFVKALDTPEVPPKLPEFINLKRKYLKIVDNIFSELSLDALIYPQMLEELPSLHSGNAIRETTVGELNIAGLPAVTVPAGYYKSGAPFELIIFGKLWADKQLINLAFSYEQNTMHRQSIFA